jgi:DNA-binding transcriptional MerR regulator
MMIVSQLSKRSGIAPHVVCYYPLSGLLTPARHPDNDYRSVCFVTQSESAHQRTKYGDAQTPNLRNPTLPLIAHARRYCTSALHSFYPDSRFTFEKIRHLLTLGEAGESPCQEVCEFMRPCVKENRWRLFDLMSCNDVRNRRSRAGKRCLMPRLARRQGMPPYPVGGRRENRDLTYA